MRGKRPQKLRGVEPQRPRERAAFLLSFKLNFFQRLNGHSRRGILCFGRSAPAQGENQSALNGWSRRKSRLKPWK